jgi:hypothetical protein
MKIFKRIASSNVLALIFLALFLPTAYQAPKILLLTIALLCFGILIIFLRVTWTPETLLACGVFAVYGLANSLHGYLNGAPGALRVLTVMTVWPILYALFSPMLNELSAVKTVVKTLQISLAFILVHTLLFIGRAADIVPDALYFEFSEHIGQGVALYDGRVRLALFSVASLLFLVPFLLHYLIYLSREMKVRWFHWLLALLGLLLTALTGRKAVQLVVFVSPVIIFMVDFVVVKKKADRSTVFGNIIGWRFLLPSFVTILVLVCILALGDISSRELVDYFLSGFEFDNSENPDAIARGDQYTSLMHAWSNGNIWFGAGNGSHTDLLRAEGEMQWSYELTYIYLLFSTGLVGVTFYAWWFVWGVRRIRRSLAKRPDMAIYVAPIVTGSIGLLMGAASNPYFGKFDYLWIIFLPHLLAGAVRDQACDGSSNKMTGTATLSRTRNSSCP